MASPIIAAVRAHCHFKESVMHTAQELAHLANIYGVAKVSYRYLADRCHCSRRTAMRHIAHLIAAKVIKKTVIWIRGNFCEWNTYTFCIAWNRRQQNEGSAKMECRFPPTIQTAKTQGVREQIKNMEWSLRNIPMPAEAYSATREKIARLQALLPADTVKGEGLLR